MSDRFLVFPLNPNAAAPKVYYVWDRLLQKKLLRTNLRAAMQFARNFNAANSPEIK